MEQLINDFSPGLFAMQAFILLLLIFAMRILAWRPILDALQIREDGITEALESAENAKAEMQKLNAKNVKILEEAKLERDNIIKQARDAGSQMLEEAKNSAAVIGSKMIEDAKITINTEKQAALTEVKNQVALLSLEIAEKLVRKQLSGDKAQKEMVASFIKDANLN
jgi:F-type H+-transporting ATPase subunit b